MIVLHLTAGDYYFAAATWSAIVSTSYDRRNVALHEGTTARPRRVLQAVNVNATRFPSHQRRRCRLLAATPTNMLISGSRGA